MTERSQSGRGPLAGRGPHPIVLGVVAILLLKAVLAYPTALETLAQGNTDDVVRLLSVRAWLEGQGWYDMRLYRALPPEGVPLHWSRLLDAALALLGAPVRLLAGPEAAERFVLVAWPTLLLIALIAVTWRGVNRILGPIAGWLSVLTLYLWGVIEATYFDVARIDHHNVQILLATIVFFAAISDRDPRRRGLVAGIATALSLAVGLEALVLLAGLGAIVAGRGLLGDGALRWYAGSLPLAAAALFALQVPPGGWGVPWCDALAPPVLALLALAALAAFAALSLPPRPLPRLAVAGAVLLAGLVLLRPLVGPCLAGPYGALDADLQARISSDISEARSAASIFASAPAGLLATFAPVVGAILLAAGTFWRDRLRPRETLCALGVGLATLAAALLQVRQLVLVAPVLPFLTARGVAPLVAAVIGERGRDALPPLLAGLGLTLLSPAIVGAAAPLFGENAKQGVSIADADCRTGETMRALAGLPVGTVLASTNLGPAILLSTPHNVLAVPYHRSEEALRITFEALRLPDEELREFLGARRADYLLLCDGSTYGDGLATRLAAGETVDWLEPVPLDAGPARLFRVAP